MIVENVETTDGKARLTKGNIHAPGNTDTIAIQISEATPTSSATINGSTAYCLSVRFSVLYSYCFKFSPKSTFLSETCNKML